MNRDELMKTLKKTLRILPDKQYVKLYFHLRLKRKLNLKNPRHLMISYNG